MCIAMRRSQQVQCRNSGSRHAHTPQAAALSRRRRGRGHGREGSVVVEFAFVAILLGGLVIGVFEITRAIMVKEQLTNAARRACRMGAQGVNSSNTAYTNTDLTNDVTTTLGEYGLSGANPPTILVNGVSADVSTATHGQPISVQISIPSSSMYWTTNHLFSGWKIQSEPIVMMRQQ